MLTALMVVWFWATLGGSVLVWHMKRKRRQEVRLRRWMDRLTEMETLSNE